MPVFTARFLDYVEEVCSGSGIPEKKLVRDLLWGTLKSGSLLISDIARSLEEKNTLDSTEVRLTNGIRRFDHRRLSDRIAERISSILSSPVKVCIDESDINKEQSRKLEDLCLVRDGSAREETYVNGYHVTGITIVGGSENYIFPVSLGLYSTETEGYTSLYDQTVGRLGRPVLFLEEKKIAFLMSFDRGYDDAKFIKYCDKTGIPYVIRAKSMRKYGVNGKRLTINEMARSHKGKYSFDFIDADGQKKYVKAGYIKAGHRDIGQFCLVFERHSDTDIRFYITNVDQDGRDSCRKVLKAYRIRWRIEELFRFIKQGFGFEYMLVRSLNAMNTMAAIAVMAVNFMTEIMLEKGLLFRGITEAWPQFRSAVIRKQKKLELGRYGFEYYAMQQGILAVLRHSRKVPEIKKRIRKKQSFQLSLFDMI